MTMDPGLMVEDDGRLITLTIVGDTSYTMPPFLAREIAANLLNRADIIEPLPEQDGWEDA